MRRLGLLEAARVLSSREGLGYLRAALRAFSRRKPAECPCCGYVGPFGWAGIRVRLDARCPRCGSMERHRLMALAVRDKFVDFSGTEVLHFAPEPCIAKLVDAQHPKSRVTADINPAKAELVLDIENLDLADQRFDRIVCSHVLEHVDDKKALREMYRVLRPGGQAVIMLPIVEGWAESYEEPSITDPAEREKHFGQDDHVRYFGADLRRRIADAGFTLGEYTAGGAASVRYNLQRGEKVFLATRE